MLMFTQKISALMCGIILFAAALGVPAQPARAHADLVSAEPAPNSTITTAPKQLRLVFDEKLVALGTKIRLIDAAGAPVALGKGFIDPDAPKAFIVPIEAPDKLAAGAFTVRWTAQSEDGHLESGVYRFKLAKPAEAAAPSATTPEALTLRFALKAGPDAVTCGKDIAKLGKGGVSAQIADARMHIGNVRLIGASGKETPVALIPDDKWQSDKIALLDFENATGLCREAGTVDTRTEIRVKAPAGKFTGIAFDMGLPFEINHADVATAKAPLNLAAMWWNWQGGYKFARLDVKANANGTKTPDAFLIHLGSTGCGDMANKDMHSKGSHGTMDKSAMSKPPTKPCKNPNIVTVRLRKFDPAKDVIVADLAALLANIDIANPAPQPAGCMSGIDDSDCAPLFPNFGLSLKTGLCENNCKNQKLFRVEAAKP